MNSTTLYRLLAYGLGSLLFCVQLGVVIFAAGGSF